MIHISTTTALQVLTIYNYLKKISVLLGSFLNNIQITKSLILEESVNQ